MRSAYLDNIRWGTVLLVFLYHICYLFNGVGVPGGIPGAESLPALDVFAAALVYPIAVVSGTGPLWFAQMLFLFSCLLMPVRRLDRGSALEKLPAWAVFLLFLPLWGSSQVLNVPVLTMYRFGIYLAAFLMGYFILSHEKIQRELERFRLPLAGMAAASGAVCTVRWLGKNYTDPACLQSLPANLCAWSAVLAVLGLGRRHLNRESVFTRYIDRKSTRLNSSHS